MSTRVNNQADFGYKIEFSTETKDPGRIFRALSKLVDFSEVTDRNLIRYLEIDLKSNLTIESIEQGSLVVWFKNTLSALGEDKYAKSITDKVRLYLIESKALIIKIIGNKPLLESGVGFPYISDSINKLMVDTGLNELGIYSSLKPQDLLQSIDKFQLAASELQGTDKLSYLTREYEVKVSFDSIITDELKENLIFQDIKVISCERILKVKKPDYLGESKWELRDGRTPIEAKINDSEWLEKFKNREIIIAPGDSIKVKLETTIKYDVQGNFLIDQHIIQKVIEVITKVSMQQLNLPIDDT